MRMCHLKANKTSVDGMHLSLENLMKPNQASEPKRNRKTKSESSDIFQQIKSQLSKQQVLLRWGCTLHSPTPLHLLRNSLQGILEPASLVTLRVIDFHH